MFVVKIVWVNILGLKGVFLYLLVVIVILIIFGIFFFDKEMLVRVVGKFSDLLKWVIFLSFFSLLK